MDKFSKFFNLDSYQAKAQNFIDQKIQAAKKEAAKKLAGLFTFLLLAILLIFIFCLMIGFLSLALGSYLNYLLNSSYLGFLVMALVLLAFMIGIFFMHKLIRLKIYSFTSSLLDLD